MDLSEVLSRRRACRDFLDEPVSSEVVSRLLYAIGRAPTASNVPYREVVVVDDPRVIRTIKQLHPALLSSPPLLVVIVTNLSLARRRVGKVGELSSLIDSGAAGENVVLQATALDLGSQFTMVSAMAGIRRILALPDDYRVDLIIPIGLPAKKGRRAGAAAAVTPVHHNRFGIPHEPASA